MLRAIGLGLSCLIIWLLLSGHYTPPLMSFGVLSSVLVVWLSKRMGLLDETPVPALFYGRFLRYCIWLSREIVRSNIDVTRRILDPTLPISPTLIQIKSSQSNDLSRAIFANSITLTPGTVTTRLHKDIIEVHALSEEGAEALLNGEMDRRVSWVEQAPRRLRRARS